MGGEKPFSSALREADALYQKDRLVARARDPEVDEEAKEVRFGEIYASDDLWLPDECEFQNYTILVRRVAYATKALHESPERGRILRGVTATILGYRSH